MPSRESKRCRRRYPKLGRFRRQLPSPLRCLPVVRFHRPITVDPRLDAHQTARSALRMAPLRHRPVHGLSTGPGCQKSSQHLLKGRYVQQFVCQQALQFGVLRFQVLQRCRLRYLQPGILRASLVGCRVTDTVLATQLRHPEPHPVLLRYLDDLFFAEPAPGHLSPFLLG